LEDYAVRFENPSGALSQRRRFRDYLAGRPAQRDRNKTLTALAGAEPMAGGAASGGAAAAVLVRIAVGPGAGQRRRLELLLAEPATAPYAGGVLVIDDSGTARTARRPRTWALSVAGPVRQDR
jgi:hypothetical protein